MEQSYRTPIGQTFLSTLHAIPSRTQRLNAPSNCSDSNKIPQLHNEGIRLSHDLQPEILNESMRIELLLRRVPVNNGDEH